MNQKTRQRLDRRNKKASKSARRERLEAWLNRPIACLPLAPDAANVQRAKAFLLEQWQARAAERNAPKPRNLEGACKFASLFAVKVFGGQMRGNWHHQYVLLDGPNILDLTDGAGVPPALRYNHDPSFWFNPDHLDSLLSCLERVDNWIVGFTKAKHEVSDG